MTLPEPGIIAALNDVSIARLQADVEALAALDRRATEPHVFASAMYVRKALLAAGYSQAETQLVTFPFPSSQRNVVCRPTEFSKPAILVCAHYDSISVDPGTAPGADDNASGVAGMLEIARLLAGTSLDHHVMFSGFGAEEHDLAGSRHLAAIARGANWPLVLVINLDMIGFNAPNRLNHMVVEFEPVSRGTPLNDAASRAFGLVMIENARTYTDLVPEAGPLKRSDHLSFESMGFPCIGAVEGPGNHNKHRATDLPSSLDFEYMRKIVHVVLATILTFAK